MDIDYVVILTIITYIFGAITKTFVDKVPNKFIPLQNVLIGIIAGLICYFVGVETDLVQALVLCLIASMGAGGIADLEGIKETD